MVKSSLFRFGERFSGFTPNRTLGIGTEGETFRFDNPNGLSVPAGKLEYSRLNTPLREVDISSDTTPRVLRMLLTTKITKSAARVPRKNTSMAGVPPSTVKQGNVGLKQTTRKFGG